MPLIKSTSNKARSTNIKEMIEAGHPPKQAEAASYRNQADLRKQRNDWATKGKRTSSGRHG